MDSIGNRSCKRIMHEKHPLHKIMCVLIRCMIKGFRWRLLLFDWEINSFSKTNVTSEGAVSHNVLYYQQLSIARYEVCFDANNYLELQPLRWVVSFTMVICIVSSHFDLQLISILAVYEIAPRGHLGLTTYKELLQWHLRHHIELAILRPNPNLRLWLWLRLLLRVLLRTYYTSTHDDA